MRTLVGYPSEVWLIAVHTLSIACYQRLSCNGKTRWQRCLSRNRRVSSQQCLSLNSVIADSHDLTLFTWLEDDTSPIGLWSKFFFLLIVNQ